MYLLYTTSVVFTLGVILLIFIFGVNDPSALIVTMIAYVLLIPCILVEIAFFTSSGFQIMVLMYQAEKMLSTGDRKRLYVLRITTALMIGCFLGMLTLVLVILFNSFRFALGLRINILGMRFAFDLPVVMMLALVFYAYSVPLAKSGSTSNPSSPANPTSGRKSQNTERRTPQAE